MSTTRTRKGKRPAKPRSHTFNMEAELQRATREMERSKRLIEAGESFAGRQRSGPERSPSSFRAAR